MLRFSALALLVVLLCLPAAAQQDRTAPESIDPTLLEKLEFRSVGPFRGGRVTAVSGFADRPYNFVMGSTGGGVWVTDDAGETWENVTDGFLDVGSIGAVEVAPGDANVMYVGTGSACVRGNVSIGRGMWRSTDRGRSWTFAGLKEVGQIGRLAIDPRDPDRVFAAALGNPFGKNEERGVFRSTDGGTSWEKVLFVSDSTGAIDIVMNPSNPRELYAAFWRAERRPWTLVDASTDGGVWKSEDGGDTWKKLEGDLPGGLTGRIGLAISPAQPERVWALVNAADPEGGIWRSDDSGSTWQKINRDRRFRQRHWYYSHLIADPKDSNTLYVLNTGMYRSVDGGENWERVAVPHGDVHALWIHPDHPDRMVVGNDGGAQVSLSGGTSWSTMHNQPTAEIYRLEVDDAEPYRLYGAQQDNTTISIPSDNDADLDPVEHWRSVGGSESGHVSVNVQDPDQVWAGNYIGQIDRSDLSTGYRRDVIIYPQMQDGTAPRDLRYRFQWNAPILVSRHDPTTVYHASNHVHRTRDGGMTWETISPDLTTDNEAQQVLPGGPLQHDHTGVEVYNTIFVLEESPDDAAELWAGSDDGLVHITRDGGTTWTDITPDDMPVGGTVNSIDLVRGRPGEAAMAVYRYREDDFRPYVFLTTDFGDSWTLMTNGIPEDEPVRVVRRDPMHPSTLFAGTEFGLYVSFDGGEWWQGLQLNLPRTPVTDLAVHRGDLVVATQGRSFWILDHLDHLQALAGGVPAGETRLFPIEDASLSRMSGYRGNRAPQNSDPGMVAFLYLPDTTTSEVTLEIVDGEGSVVRRFAGAPGDEDRKPEDRDDGIKTEKVKLEHGMNRFTWDRRYTGPDVLEDAQFSLARTSGMMAPPGSYGLRMTSGTVTRTEFFSLVADPRFVEVSDRDLVEQFDLGVMVRDHLSRVHDAIRSIRSIREQTGELAERVAVGPFDEATIDSLEAARDRIADALQSVEEALIQTKSETGQDPINFPPMLDDQLAYLYSHVISAYGRPTAGDYERYLDLEAAIQPHLDGLEAVISGDLALFESILKGAEIPAVIVPEY